MKWPQLFKVAAIFCVYGINVWLYLFYRLSLQKIICLFVICKAEI